MMKLRWINEIPKDWIDITYNSLSAWEARDQLSPFRPDNRRGYPRVTPIALSSIGVPGSKVQPVDQYPIHDLGFYDDYEVSAEFREYKWATCTTMEAQPMQVDPALQAMIDQVKQKLSDKTESKYSLGAAVGFDVPSLSMGGGVSASGIAVPFPASSEDVSMESSADKRSRESPDSTLKPEGKSLKKSESTTAMTTSESTKDAGTSAGDNVKPLNVSKRPKTIPEAKSLMRDVHHRMPAWKAEKLIMMSKEDQVDLAALGDATGILFDSREMMREAVQCLECLRNEKNEEGDTKSGVQKPTDPTHVVAGSADLEGEKASQKVIPDGMFERHKPSSSTGDANKEDNKSSSKVPKSSTQQQDASASKVDQDSEGRPMLCKNHIKDGLLESPMKHMKSYGIQKDQEGVLPS